MTPRTPRTLAEYRVRAPDCVFEVENLHNLQYALAVKRRDLTMRDKKWVDCPLCGAKGAMRYKKGLKERFIPPGYEPIGVKGLDGSFCQECGDGFWSLKSKAAIAKQLAENMAAQDSKRIVASEMVSVKEAAKVMHVTPQGIHKMMDEGRIRYVYAAGLRFPIRKDLTEKAAAFKAHVAAGKRPLSPG